MPRRHRPELPEAVAGERMVGHRRSARTFGPGRTCAQSGCITRLSIYNSGDLCAAHAAAHLGPLEHAVAS
ncbi:MAG: hypothetical protein ACYDD6_09045 [Acidimicrobiales bacterium]